MFAYFFLSTLFPLYDVLPYTYTILWILSSFCLHTIKYVDFRICIIQGLYSLLIFVSIDGPIIHLWQSDKNNLMPMLIFYFMCILLLVSFLSYMVFPLSDVFIMMICISCITRYIIVKSKWYILHFLIFFTLSLTMRLTY